MRRAEGLVEFSRRGFCAACAGVAAGAALAACTDGDRGAIGTGPLGAGGPGGSGSDNPDANTDHPDAPGTITPDAAPAGTCPASGAQDVGAPSSFQLNKPVYISTGRFFVVKDSNGFYALTSLCTHEGAVTVVSSGEFYCPRHGATFTFNGAVTGGPVNRPLVHYAMCTQNNGNLGVMTSQTVPASTRLVP